MSKQEINLFCVRVGFWAESKSSYNLLVDESKKDEAYSRNVWFPKSVCKIRKYKRKNGSVGHFLIAPEWILKKNNVKLLKNVR